MEKNNVMRFGVFITFYAFLLFGCRPIKSPVITPSAKQTISPIPSPTFTVKPIVTPTRQAALRMKEECAKIVPRLDDTPEGVIAVQDEGSRIITLLDLQNGQRKLFDQAMFIMAISPDNKQLAYTDEKSGQLKILSSNGDRISNVAIPKDWVGVIQWLNKDTLLMARFIIPYQSASSIVYNLRTSMNQEFYTDRYPGGRFNLLQWGNFTYTGAVYDTSFSRVVYSGVDNQNNPVLILWNLDTKRAVLEFYQDDYFDLNGAPQWAQDGSFFVVAISPKRNIKNISGDLPYKGGYELVRVSRDGEVQRLTYLTTEYNAGIEAFSLSPDTKHVAFWLNPDHNLPVAKAVRSLAVLDIATGEIINLCIFGGESSISPIWSPDGKYLVASRYSAENTVDVNILPDVLLIEIAQKKAIRIAEKAVARGWMVK